MVCYRTQCIVAGLLNRDWYHNTHSRKASARKSWVGLRNNVYLNYILLHSFLFQLCTFILPVLKSGLGDNTFCKGSCLCCTVYSKVWKEKLQYSSLVCKTYAFIRKDKSCVFFFFFFFASTRTRFHRITRIEFLRNDKTSAPCSESYKAQHQFTSES